MDNGDSLEALLADAVAAEAARQRSADRMLRQAAAEEATFTTVLVDLAERGEPVALRTSSGRVHRGVVRAVGRDFAVVQGAGNDGSPPIFVRLSAVTSVVSAQPPVPLGDRRPPLEASLAAVLGGLAPHRPGLQIGVSGPGEPAAYITGELASAGFDVLLLRRPNTVVPLGAVAEIVVLDR